MRFTVVLQWDPETEVFGVTVPALPGCFTVGATVPEAMERAREAIEGHVATLVDLGEDVPAEQEPVIVTSVEARVPASVGALSGYATAVILLRLNRLTR